MTDEELANIKAKLVAQRTFVEEHRKLFSRQPWWRDDAFGIVVLDSAEKLLAEVERLEERVHELEGDLASERDDFTVRGYFP